MRPFERINKKQGRTILFTSILIAILLGFNSFGMYYMYQVVERNQKEEEWSYIASVLYENQEKATVQSNFLKDTIVDEIGEAYLNDKDSLRNDLNSLDINSKLMQVLNDNLQGKYLNVENDNNDLFVLSTWNKNEKTNLLGKVIWDKSVNCATRDDYRSLDTELSMHYNYDLCYDALNRILSQNKEKPIFWEYLTSNDSNHSKLDYDSLEGLKEIYMKEGIKGLKTYEILVPAYINDTNDMLNNQRINNSGTYNTENRQIVIVQGFSLYDALTSTPHMTTIVGNEKSYDTILNSIGIIGISSFIISLTILISISKIQNLSSDITELIESLKV